MLGKYLLININEMRKCKQLIICSCDYIYCTQEFIISRNTTCIVLVLQNNYSSFSFYYAFFGILERFINKNNFSVHFLLVLEKYYLLPLH